VLVSGAGTGLMALAADPPPGLEIVLVAADRPCPAIAWAEAAGFKTARLQPHDAEAMLALLHAEGVEFVLLSGYMRLVPAEVVEPFFGRLVNIHPSLLPAFPGRDAIGQALAYGVKVTGATLHLVDAEVDHGPILLQEAVPVEDEDTWESLRARLRPVEVRLMREGLRRLAAGQLVVEGRRVRWR
jgi:phosphoribosylglycinamide formyltransferase-1